MSTPVFGKSELPNKKTLTSIKSGPIPMQLEFPTLSTPRLQSAIRHRLRNEPISRENLHPIRWTVKAKVLRTRSLAAK
uniref:Uncharacterized protein n=1 Tax=Daphnia galeata TaxID=27404 RepID=A0A8J2RHZ7_9CRUS|nr:unnamed protein product [Daphnia galeata]